MNLACNSATIGQGLLGPEGRGGETEPAQIDALQRATHASAVIVSVGADDLDWSAMLRLCAVAKTCNDKATTAYFQQQLHSFSKNYLQLLDQLAALPSHPQVIINRYYNPFDLRLSCLSRVGLTAAGTRMDARLSWQISAESRCRRWPLWPRSPSVWRCSACFRGRGARCSLQFCYLSPQAWHGPPPVPLSQLF